MLRLALALACVVCSAGAAAAQPATLTGRVTGPGGAGLPGVSVTATPEAAGAPRTATTGAGGAYTLEGLAAGAYRVSVSGAGVGTPPARAVELRPGEVAELPIRLATVVLGELVVTGSTTDAAVAARDLERWQAADLADVFRTVPSVSVGGSVGIAQKVYLRGVEDTQLNVSVDGAQLTGTLFHHIGRVSVEPELLERVDVQTGAGEATAGFGALGGAIRFRTRDAQELLAPGQRAGALVRGGYHSNDGRRTSVTGFGRLGGGWGLLGSYVFMDRGNMRDGAGDEMFGTAAEQALGFVKLSGALAGRQRVSLSYEWRNEEGEFGQRPNWPVRAGEPLFPGRAGRRTATASYRVAAGPLLSLEVTAYDTRSRFEQDRHDRWGRYGASMETRGLDARNTLRLGGHALTYGVQHRADRVESEYLGGPEVWAEWAWDADVGRFREEGTLFGAYVQEHFRVAPPLLLSAGLRYDRYRLEQATYGDGTRSDGLSGNVGVQLELPGNLSLSAGVAQALRGKEVGDAFTLERRPGRVSLDPQLQPERATNRELGVVFDDGRWRATASAYRMSIRDVIQDQLGGGPAPQDAVYYENVGTLETDGVELGLGYAAGRLDARLFYTTFDAELDGRAVEGYEHIGLASSSGARWSAAVRVAPARGVELGWNLTAVQGLEDIEVLHRALELGWVDALQRVDKPGYAVHDVAAEWRPLRGRQLTLGLAVQNLLDARYRDHASVADYNHIPDWEGIAGLYEAGRDVRLSVGLRF